MNHECPICGSDLTISADAIIGELIDCASCESEVEVLATQPAFVLAEAPCEAEDWGE